MKKMKIGEKAGWYRSDHGVSLEKIVAVNFKTRQFRLGQRRLDFYMDDYVWDKDGYWFANDEAEKNREKKAGWKFCECSQ